MLTQGSANRFVYRAGWIYLPIFGLIAVLAHGQAGSSASPVPNDPKAMIVLASQSNGLVGSNIQPWHLKASFKLFDSKGKTSEEGTIEEFWYGHHKFRVTYVGKNFAQTTYWTDGGVLQSGSADVPSYLILELRGALVEPMPAPEFLQTKIFEAKESELGTVKLACMTAKIALPANSDEFQKTLGPTYCMSTEKPVLRVNVNGQGMRQVLRNKILSFQGRYIPQELRIVQHGDTVATLQVDSLETIKTPDDSLFVPSTDAKLLASPTSVLSGMANGMLVISAYPHYPLAAKQSRISGTVIFQAVIGKDGKISNLQVESGPSLLRQAAMDAVKQWVYWPFFVDGEAVEVATKINVIFNLGS